MIDPKLVTALFEQALSNNETDMVVEGILHSYRISKDAVERDRAVIKAWITDLPLEFLMEHGGGWSFLNLCRDRNGEQWSGLHMVCEQLFVLAASLNMAKILLPRSMWSTLPGGVPYLAFTLQPGGFPQKEEAQPAS